MKEKELKPCLLVFAGPNGSGKSTIKSMFEIKGKYTNADDVVASTGMDNLEAAKLVDEMRYESIRNKEDFSFETVLSSDYKMNILRKAKEEGYFIKCVFVLTANPELNVYRVESRVSKGGHDVPADKIIDRYAKTFETDGCIAWTDKQSAIYYALASEWKEIGDNHYCPDCYKFNDVLNVYVPKKKEDK